MIEMRKFINLVESIYIKRIDELYSSNNKYLQHYMKNAEFDPYQTWHDVCEWLEENDHLELVSELLGHEINSADDLREEEPDVFYQLPPELQKECGEAVVEHLVQHDPAEAPTWAHMSLNDPKLLPRTTWLVHFTDHPYDIAQQGFTIGMDQMDKLGLTTWFKNEGDFKKHGGYNFAFKALSRHADFAAHKGKYGQSAVLFQNSGVHAYHYGDEEDQVIFWGEEVSPKNIIVLVKEDDTWHVKTRHRLRNGQTSLFAGDYENCVKWVVQNSDQYRRKLR